MTMKNEMLTLEELDRVNGATLDEVYELSRRMLSHDKSGFLRTVGPVAQDIAKFCQNTLQFGQLAAPANLIIKKGVSNILTARGIKHDLSVGFLGTGWGDDPNRYEFNGKRISHAEVMKMI